MAWSSIARCRSVFLGAEMSWVRSVLGPKCLDTTEAHRVNNLPIDGDSRTAGQHILPHNLYRTSTQCKVLPCTWNRIKYKSPWINELQVIHIAVTKADKPCSAVWRSVIRTSAPAWPDVAAWPDWRTLAVSNRITHRRSKVNSTASSASRYMLGKWHQNSTRSDWSLCWHVRLPVLLVLYLTK